jgi:divalent metal cation (Fe/Co/Zn/Cd) transporter
MKIAHKRKSSVLASNAMHHRVDSLTGIVTLAAILGANLLADAAWLDPVGGLLISLMIVKAGWTNTLSSLYELADQSIDAEIATAVRAAASHGLSTAVSATYQSDSEFTAAVRDVQGTKSGQNLLLEVLVDVPAECTVQQTQQLAAGVRAAIAADVNGARRIAVRFSTQSSGDRRFLDEFLAASNPTDSAGGTSTKSYATTEADRHEISHK